MKILDIVSFLSYTISKMIPKKRNRWIFGAWFGTAVSDNTKSVFDYVQQHHPEIEKIWIVDEPSKYQLDGCRFVKRNSISSLKYILTAQIAVMNQGYGDFCAVNLLGRCFKVQLWHGIAWKKIMRDAIPQKSGIDSMLFNYVNQYDLYIAPSDIYKETVKTAFGAKDEQILLCGQPRNDLLFDDEFCKSCHESLLKYTGQKNKKIIVYMPTFRDKTNEVFSFCQNDTIEKMKSLAEQYNFIVIEKSHYKSYERMRSNDANQLQFVYTLPTLEAQTLLAGADMLITDYSSCFFDFVVRNKPIIHYAYDYDYYKNMDRGLYYPIEEVSAGSVAYTVDALLKAIQDNFENTALAEDRRKYVRQKYVTYENRDNTKTVVDQVARRTKRG